jgi:hypothetical protein
MAWMGLRRVSRYGFLKEAVVEIIDAKGFPIKQDN